MLKGVFTPMVTAFDEEGGLDLESNGRIIRHLIDGGMDGILLLGSIGEFFALTMAEKRELIGFAADAIGGRAALLVGTGGTVVQEVIELTRHAEQAGADAAVVISPYYFLLDEASLYAYYAQVAAHTAMPVVLYNFPDRTGVSMSPGLVLRLAGDFENIQGIKDTVDCISHTRAVIDTVKPELPDFAVLSGFDEYLLPNLLAGGDGLIGGLSNIAPRLVVGIYQAYQKGDLAKLAGLQRRLNILMRLYGVSQPFVGAIKAAVSLVLSSRSQRNILAACRSPAADLTADQLAAVRDILRQAGVLEQPV